MTKGARGVTGEFAVAVHALVYLNHKARTLSSDELAENICTNPARVRKVLARLKKAGLVETKEGASGGYAFAGDPEKLTLRRIDEALAAPLVCASWRPGSSEKKCLIASGMGGILDDIYLRLNEACLRELERITIAQIDRRIFSIEA